MTQRGLWRCSSRSTSPPLECPHLKVESWMGAVRPSGGLADHAHQEGPAPLQEGLGQAGAIAGAGDQPNRLGRVRGRGIPLVKFQALHQDVAPCA